MAINVLVVDDSAVMRAMIIKALHLCGLPLGEIHQAANGKDGLKVLDKNWIDLSLVDINMPVMGGVEMIDKVRENPDMADLAIIVVSTESSETRIEMLEKKKAGFVHKPFSPEVLRKLIIEKTGVTDEQVKGDAYQSNGFDF
ncbi:MAG: response regulator [Actinobacteria bacterium]|nr:response regulator [Actinomycetota bacterium]